MNKVIALLVDQSDAQKLKMCSIFYNRGEIVAEIYLYTEKESFFGKINRKDLNKEVIWDKKSIYLLEEGFKGTNKKTFIHFSHDKNLLKFGARLDDSSMKITFFEKTLINLDQLPFENMQRNFQMFRESYNEEFSKLQKDEKEERQTIEVTKRQKQYVKDRYQMQENMMKDKFIPIINQLKERIKQIMSKYVEQIQENKKVGHIRQNKQIKQKEVEEKKVLNEENENQGFQHLFKK